VKKNKTSSKQQRDQLIVMAGTFYFLPPHSRRHDDFIGKKEGGCKCGEWGLPKRKAAVR
jgi:hypothetical protein